MKLNAYGKIIEVIRSGDKWQVFYVGTEGKKRDARGLIIPSHISQEEVIHYLEDILHEGGKPENPHIKIIP